MKKPLKKWTNNIIVIDMDAVEQCNQKDELYHEILPNDLHFRKIWMVKEKMNVSRALREKSIGASASPRIARNVHHTFLILICEEGRYYLVEKYETHLQILISSYFEDNSRAEKKNLVIGLTEERQIKEVAAIVDAAPKVTMHHLKSFLGGERGRGYKLWRDNCQHFAQRCFNLLSKDKVAELYS